MSIAQQLCAEIEQESHATRATLEVIPEDRWDFKAHEKSFSIRQLASHIVDTFSWIGSMTDVDDFDFDPGAWTPYAAETKDDLLAKHDANLAAALAKLAEVPDEAMGATWTMTMNGQVAMQSPRLSVIRMMLISHTIHHRAQLGVYLRLCDVPLPEVYGPSADSASG